MMPTKKKLLLVSPVATHPTISGNAVRPIYLAKQLRQLGYTIHFAFTDYVGHNSADMSTFWGRDQYHYFPYHRGRAEWEVKRFARALRLTNTRLSHWWRSRKQRPANPRRVRPKVDDYYDESMSPWLARLHEREQYDAVIAHFVILSRALEAFPSQVSKILDTQEVFAVGREKSFERGEQCWIDISPEDELSALRRADHVWTSQQHEEEVLRPWLGDRVSTVSHFVDPIPAATESSLNSRKIVFVGGNHSANVEGIRWFASEVYPHLRHWLSPEEVVVVGNVKNAVGAEMPFRFMGPVADLGPVYANVRAAICPIISGTGLKSKNVEAFAYSKPVVTTSFGRLGMEDADTRAHLVADKPADFAEAIRRLLTDDGLCRDMMFNALTYARDWNDRLQRPMLRCLQSKAPQKLAEVGV